MQSLSPATNGTSAARCAWSLLNGVPPVNWMIRREMRSHRRGLSVPQFRTLVLVEREPAANLSDVAKFLGSSLPTASRIVGGLVTKGFIERSGCADDRRQLSLLITARGHSVLNAAMEKTQAELANEVQRFTPRQRAVISEAMEILTTAFGSLTSASGKMNGELNDTAEKTSISYRSPKPRLAVRS
jgi:DNA-binding MarR family transcriptional regulator